jgi:hypothetical protein
MAREYPTVLDLIGHTPIVRLDRVGRDVRPLLLAKLEYLNPGGSNKDRIGTAMIDAAERERPGRGGGHSGVEIVDEEQQQRQLLVRARRERPSCRQQADVGGYFTAPEEVDEWRANAGVHQAGRYCSR